VFAAVLVTKDLLEQVMAAARASEEAKGILVAKAFRDSKVVPDIKVVKVLEVVAVILVSAAA
jgi:hypothetical protein